MRNITLSILFMIIGIINGTSQDTFSIVAMDPITGEVGSAGASCVDLDANNLPTDDFLGELFPGLGAINSQAYYIPANQANARARMNEGYTPNEIIEWLINNDVQNQPQFRQYGIVGKVGENIETAAYTGVATDDYKNDITGPNYSIQGNILLGEEVLNGMEAGFLNTEGDLACKLMGALQGANIVGADFRCTNNGTSSLFAFVKVAQPSDTFGNPSFLLSVRTGSTDQIEPITELQILFDENRDCESLSLIDFDNDFPFSVYPNPSNDFVSLRALNDSETYNLTIISITGAVVYTSDFISNTGIDVSGISKGIYFINITNKIASYTSKWIKN
ncbi:MAG: DUF1028 domain-containing protein [Flavobacteriaceae bacterium]|nr:DUF1028 domain-containing protein [Flavobacteriaceae bacterium]